MKPEMLATAPNQVWSWDITKLKGPTKCSYFGLYVILDILSRYVVGWMVAPRENAVLAKKLLDESVRKQGIEPGRAYRLRRPCRGFLSPHGTLRCPTSHWGVSANTDACSATSIPTVADK